MSKRALILAAGLTACGIPLQGEELTLEEREKVEHILDREEALRETVQTLFEESKPLFDRYGEPVDDNQGLFEDINEVAKVLNEAYDRDHIVTFQPDELKSIPDEAYGMRKKNLTPGIYDNWILLAKDGGWPIELLMHEAAHAFQSHSNEVRERAGNPSEQNLLQVFDEQRDFPYMMVVMYSIAKGPFAEMKYLAKNSKEVDHPVSLNYINNEFETLAHGSPEEIASLYADAVFEDFNEDLEYLQVDREGLERAFSNKDFAELMHSEVKSEYEWFKNEYKEELKALEHENSEIRSERYSGKARL